MSIKKKHILLVLLACGFAAGKDPSEKQNAHRKEVESTEHAVKVLWRDPADIASRNLYYGPGGATDQPHGSFRFVEEDMSGSNPKFTVVDSNGVKWKVKLGAEARPETAASRIVWAVGYSAREYYLMPHLRVQDLPVPLHRGANLIGPDGSFSNVRMERETKAHKLGSWEWRDNPFSGTRELGGLRVLMAVINNWDLKNVNNAIYLEQHGRDGQPEEIYVVKDLGATFGANGLEVNRNGEKGNLKWYEESRFITHLNPEMVSFETPRRPTLLAVVNPIQFFQRMRLRWLGRDISRNDAVWMGRLLGRLSHQQIRDAFRAANYSPDQVEGFTEILEQRISELNKLSEDDHAFPFYPTRGSTDVSAAACCTGAGSP